MALAHSPSIVRDRLIVYLDAGNIKSYNAGISTTTWNDLSGNGNTGTLTNGPTYSSANGGSILFDGTNDYMSAALSGTGCDKTTFSVDWWTKPTAVSNFDQMIYMNSSGVNTEPPQYSYWQGFTFVTNASGQWSVGTATFTPSATETSTSTLFTNGEWCHVSVSFNNGSLIVYKNAVEVMNASSTVHSSNFVLLQVGAGPGFSQGTFFDGNLAALKVYSGKALTASEVSQNFNALRGRFRI
jgi:Concanavalin A-like lectin/glucanases superfamily